ncbi:transposase [Lamprobacter modestohalophilus]|uniref:transposase n=1 Tax=Lamprobacter modestohalophilus TaxID=1064514 RepID=UPI002ADEDD7A|nr:transposase [Lamprobacter modestohalophilus]MEA1051873.1 transposase [Lamprobacter modestohalophilus]
MIPFSKTLNLRKEEISNSFLGRHSSGFVDGLNNKINVIKRCCYGLLNRAHLFQRLYLDLFGYRLYGLKIKGLHCTQG